MPWDEAVSRPLPHRTLYPIQRNLTYKDDGLSVIEIIAPYSTFFSAALSEPAASS